MAGAIGYSMANTSPSKICHSQLKGSCFVPTTPATRPRVVSPSRSHSLPSFRVSLPSTRHFCFTVKGPKTDLLQSFLTTASQCPRWSLVPFEIDNFRKADDKTQPIEDAKAMESCLSSTFKNITKKNGMSVRCYRSETSKKVRNPKYFGIFAASRNKVDQYQILKYPLRTESALKNLQLNATLVFIVDRYADKKSVRDAVKMMFGIQTRKVNTSILPDGTKKAYVMLKPGYDALEVAKKIKFI